MSKTSEPMTDVIKCLDILFTLPMMELVSENSMVTMQFFTAQASR